jgi:hypothetical protein
MICEAFFLFSRVLGFALGYIFNNYCMKNCIFAKPRKMIKRITENTFNWFLTKIGLLFTNLFFLNNF